MTTVPKPHLEAVLQHDVDHIRSKLMSMAAMDEQALTRALEAFLKGDRQLAYSIILRDQDVDKLEIEIDRLCVEFIVRHQPAAGLLRFVYSASKIVGALERIGDYAESIARQVLLLSTVPPAVPTERFVEIANLAIPMLHNSMRAFLDKNSDLARATMASEPRVNQVRDAINADLVRWRERGELALQDLPAMITVARRFERVSDYATNICEEALYWATGEYQKHRAAREGFRVLFVDDSNSCTSQMAEAIANSLSARRFTFASAGIDAGAVDPLTIQFLSDKGLDASHHRSKTVSEIHDLDQVQVMVALSKEGQKAFPKRPAKTLGFGWFVPDPSKVRGTPGEMRAAYEAAFQSLSQHIHDLVQAILQDPLDEERATE
ncbi:MAG TPA: phosphate signaling complex protein PhoU [Vicinamibacterales bacterium]|nr:phosphate signaling complex protein PhoU [Vicinamibacterales bacterium]